MSMKRKIYLAFLFALCAAIFSGTPGRASFSKTHGGDGCPTFPEGYAKQLEECLNEKLRGTGISVTVSIEMAPPDPSSPTCPETIVITPSGSGAEKLNCSIVQAVRECAPSLIDIQVVPALSEGRAQLLYKARGTDTDTNHKYPPPICVDVEKLVAKGSVEIEEGKVEKLVSADAKQLGISLDDLDVKVKKDNKGQPFIQIKGKIKQAKDKPVVIGLVSKYTGFVNFKATDLKVVPPKYGKQGRTINGDLTPTQKPQEKLKK